MIQAIEFSPGLGDEMTDSIAWRADWYIFGAAFVSVPVHVIYVWRVRYGRPPGPDSPVTAGCGVG